jgi:hypothetical protein
MLGGAFTAVKNTGSANINRVKFTEAGINMSYLTNFRLYYNQKVGTTTACDAGTSYNGGMIPVQTGGGSYSGSVSGNTITFDGITIPVDNANRTCMYVQYDTVGTFSTNLIGSYIDIYIANASADMTFSDASTAIPSGSVNISGATLIGNDEVGSTLSIRVADPAKDPTVFYVSNNAMWMKQGTNGTAIRMTPEDIRVVSATFTNVSQAGNKSAVKIRLTIRKVDPNNPSATAFTKTFEMTANVKTNCVDSASGCTQ